jgi:hypothetical protein
MGSAHRQHIGRQPGADLKVALTFIRRHQFLNKSGLYLFSIGPTASLASLRRTAHEAILVVVFQ